MDHGAKNEVGAQTLAQSRSASLATVDLLLNPESLLELVGCPHNTTSCAAPAAGTRDGHLTEDAETVSVKQLEANLNRDDESPPESAHKEYPGDSWRPGAALAVRLIEELLMRMLDITKAALPGRSKEQGQHGGAAAVRLDAEPLLTTGQLSELLRLHQLLCSVAGPSEVVRTSVGDLTMLAGDQSRGFGIKALSRLLGLLVSPSLANPADMVKHSAATTYLLEKVAQTLRHPSQSRQDLQRIEGVDCEAVGATVYHAVRLFKRTCPSACELAGLEGLDTSARDEQEEVVGVEDTPAVAVLARTLGMDAALPSFGVLSKMVALANEAFNLPEQGASVVSGAASSVQVAALTCLSAAIEWLANANEGEDFLEVQSLKSRTASEQEQASSVNQTQNQTQNLQAVPEGLMQTVKLACRIPPDGSLAKQNMNPTLNKHSIFEGLLSPSESGAAIQVARGLLGWEDLGLVKGSLDPVGQLLVYVAVVLWMELEAGLEEPLVSAYCELLSSLANIRPPPGPLLDLATGVVRGLLATFEFPAGAPLQCLTEVILELSRLESSVGWAVDAIEDCLKVSSAKQGLITERTSSKAVEASEMAQYFSDIGDNAATEGSVEALDVLELGGDIGKRGFGLEKAGCQRDGPLSEGSREDQNVAVKRESLEGRKQLLGMLVDFLVGALKSSSGGEGDKCTEGSLATKRECHVDLGLDLLMAILAVFTLLFKGWADSREAGRKGPLDERSLCGLLGGVGLALKPVIEAVVWLWELCEDALANKRAAPIAAMETEFQEELDTRDERHLERVHGETGGGAEARRRRDKKAFKHLEEGYCKPLEGADLRQLEGRELAEPNLKEQLERRNMVDPNQEEQLEKRDLGLEKEQLEGRHLGPDKEQLEAAVQLAQLGLALGSAVQRVACLPHSASMEGLTAPLARLQKHWSDLASAYQACVCDGVASGALLTALAVLCEESVDIRSSGAGFGGFRVPAQTRFFDTQGAVSDGERLGKESVQDALDEPSSPSNKGNAEEEAKAGKAFARSGREKKAPSKWWAVVEKEPWAKKRKSELEPAVKKGSSVRNRKVGHLKGVVLSKAEAMQLTPLGSKEELPEIDLEDEEKRYDKPSKKVRQMLNKKRRRAQSRVLSQNKFVAYAIEEQMLDSDPEWDSDEYSDMEDFIVLENEEVDFKTMPLAAITPYVPYEIETREAAPESATLTSA